MGDTRSNESVTSGTENEANYINEARAAGWTLMTHVHQHRNIPGALEEDKALNSDVIHAAVIVGHLWGVADETHLIQL